jgi:iron complex outermembrane recepter protein
MTFPRLPAALLPILLAIANSASGQSESRPLEEIVVTAGFRDAAQMDLAGSASVLGETLIEQRAARHLEDVLAAAPNVGFTVGGSRARFVQMRGIGDLEQFTDPKHFPSVGIVLDGIELSNVATGALLFDTEQVEVLRGPQGTRFGAAALAGLVNIRSRDPGEVFEAEATTGYGNLDTWHVGVTAGGPVTDTLGARIAVRQLKSDGFMENAFLGRDDTQNRDELAVRGKLAWQLTPDFDADLTVLHVDLDNGYDAFSLDNTRTTLSDQPGKDAVEATALAAGLGYALGAAGAVELRTTWTGSDEILAFDEDWVFRGFCDGVRCPPAFEFSAADRIERARDQVTVDLRWLSAPGRVSWVTGAYFHHRDEDLERSRFGLFTSAYRTTRYALYGELDVAVREALTLRLGIRGEAFDDKYDDSNRIATQSNDAYWSGEATLEYRARADTLFYATASRGAKPGGVNTGATSVRGVVATRFQPFVDDRLRFDTETLFNKELGLKGRYLDDRLAVRFALFHMDRSKAQLENWLWDASTFVFVGLLDNAGDAENYGAELEVDARLTRDLLFSARVGWLETRVESMTVFDLETNAFRALGARDQARAPRWQYYFGLDWDILPGLRGNLAVEGRDEVFFGYYHDGRLDGYAALNASLAWRVRAVEARLWARNLLNTDYAVHGLFFANDPRNGFANNRTYEQPGEPRVYGVELAWSF